MSTILEIVYATLRRYPRSHIGLCQALDLSMAMVEASIKHLLDAGRIEDRGWTFAVPVQQRRAPLTRWMIGRRRLAKKMITPGALAP